MIKIKEVSNVQGFVRVDLVDGSFIIFTEYEWAVLNHLTSADFGALDIKRTKTLFDGKDSNFKLRRFKAVFNDPDSTDDYYTVEGFKIV